MCLKTDSNRRLHTFGVGSGADTSLVKGAATVGNGSFYFIYDFKEIESKVVDALQNNYCTSRMLKAVNLIGHDQEVIEDLV